LAYNRHIAKLIFEILVPFNYVADSLNTSWKLKDAKP